MHILIMAFGTRGDVQPMIALGKGLEAAGHVVKIMAGENFRDWIYREGFGFAPANIDMQALMSSPTGIKWVESGRQSEQLTYMRQLLAEFGGDAVHSIVENSTDCDVIIGGFISEPFALAIGEKRGIKVMSALLQPLRVSSIGAASLVPVLPRRDSVLNRWVGRVTDRLLWSVFAPTVNEMRRQYLGLSPQNFGGFSAALRRTPTLYGFSVHVVPEAHPENDLIQTSGYWFIDDEDDWNPPVGLQEFIDDGPAPIYIGFGSMPSSKPDELFKLIRSAVDKSGVRVVIAGGWSGISGASDRIYSLSFAPHGWLFERMAGVVHHGGAGTTAAGLRAGVPALLIPHLGDQRYWARRLHELGVSVAPIPRHKLTVDVFAERLKQLAEDSTIRENAARLGEKIRAENGVEKAVATINRWLS